MVDIIKEGLNAASQGVGAAFGAVTGAAQGAYDAAAGWASGAGNQVQQIFTPPPPSQYIGDSSSGGYIPQSDMTAPGNSQAPQYNNAPAPNFVDQAAGAAVGFVGAATGAAAGALGFGGAPKNQEFGYGEGQRSPEMGSMREAKSGDFQARYTEDRPETRADGTTRAGYTPTENLGLDKKTWSYIADGMSPGEALAQRYYEETNPKLKRELDWQLSQYNQNEIERSSAEHHYKKDSDNPADWTPNTHEDSGDKALALQLGNEQEDKIQLIGSNPGIADFYSKMPQKDGKAIGLGTNGWWEANTGFEGDPLDYRAAMADIERTMPKGESFTKQVNDSDFIKSPPLPNSPYSEEYGDPLSSMTPAYIAERDQKKTTTKKAQSDDWLFNAGDILVGLGKNYVATSNPTLGIGIYAGDQLSKSTKKSTPADYDVITDIMGGTTPSTEAAVKSKDYWNTGSTAQGINGAFTPVKSKTPTNEPIKPQQPAKSDYSIVMDTMGVTSPLPKSKPTPNPYAEYIPGLWDTSSDIKTSATDGKYQLNLDATKAAMVGAYGAKKSKRPVAPPHKSREDKLMNDVLYGKISVPKHAVKKSTVTKRRNTAGDKLMNDILYGGTKRKPTVKSKLMSEILHGTPKKKTGKKKPVKKLDYKNCGI
jgi:hypothetical protein